MRLPCGLYVTECNGTYMGSLWMAGGKSKILPNILIRLLSCDSWQHGRVSTASPGQCWRRAQLKITADLAGTHCLTQAMNLIFDASGRRPLRDSPFRMVVPLPQRVRVSRSPARRYIAIFTYDNVAAQRSFAICWRALHKFSGLIAGSLIVVMTLKRAGVELSSRTGLCRPPHQPGPELKTVATLADRIAISHYPVLNRIRRAPIWRITAFLL